MPIAASDASARILPRYRVFRGGEIVLGPGKAELLELIAQTGSLSEAARRMEMSYNRAWLHLKVMNERFASPLVHTSRGGSAKGGAELTPLGREVLTLYRRLESEAEQATASTQQALLECMKRTS